MWNPWKHLSKLYQLLSFPVRDIGITSCSPKCPKCGNATTTSPGKTTSKCSNVKCNRKYRLSEAEVSKVMKMTVDEKEITVFFPKLFNIARNLTSTRKMMIK